MLLSENKFRPAFGQIGLWPLNKAWQGKNMIQGNGDFVLNNVAFDTDAGPWKSAPASFSYSRHSSAELMNEPKISVAGSFSWIGSIMKRGKSKMSVSL